MLYFGRKDVNEPKKYDRRRHMLSSKLILLGPTAYYKNYMFQLRNWTQAHLETTNLDICLLSTQDKVPALCLGKLD